MGKTTIKECLAGNAIYGDDFDINEIECWYHDEKEAYAQLIDGNSAEKVYGYHAQNKLHGYRYLGNRKFDHVLGLGSALGYEFEPIASRIKRLSILEPSNAFGDNQLFGIPCEYIKPEPNGNCPFADSTFDLATSIGVLHHIPNVSHVIREVARCLKSGGHFLIREPIVSMGDWTQPRPNLTKHERGLPLKPFLESIKDAGLLIRSAQLCRFAPLKAMHGKFATSMFNSQFWTRVDAFLSQLMQWNYRYHATEVFHKFRPTVIYVVATKVE